MPIINWSSISNGQDITGLYDPLAGGVLNFDDGVISAGDRSLLTWVGNLVTIQAGGKTFTFTVTGGGRVLSTTNVTFANGSQLLVGDNSTTVGTNGSGVSDDAGNFLAGTAFGDRFFGLGGSDTMIGGDGGDVFVLGAGPGNFGSDVVDGGNGSNFIGIGTSSSITSGGTVDFDTHTVVSDQGSATFSNIEHAFGTILDDIFYAFDSTLSYTGLAFAPGFNFNRILEGYAGNDLFVGDPRPGMSETVRYQGAETGVFVNLALGFAFDGHDLDSATPGVQQGVDLLIDIGSIQGSDHNDTLIGGGTALQFSAIPSESFEGRAGNDVLDANGHTNVLANYSNSPSGVAVDLLAGTALDGWDSDTITGGVQPYTDTLIGIANVIGSNFADVITGNNANNVLEGRGGDDTLDGGAGNDIAMFGNASAGISVDLASGVADLSAQGLGTDTFVNIEGLRGGDFGDTLIGVDGVDNVLQGKAGADVLDGRSGTDRARYDDAPNAVSVDLGAGTAFDGYDSNPTPGIQAYQDTLIGIEAVRGSLHDDTIIGDGNANSIEGWAGNDLLSGGGGNDKLEYTGSQGGATVNLTSGIVDDDGWGGIDTVSGFEMVQGSAFGDSIVGTDVADTLAGGNGGDTLVGGAGNDQLIGGLGDDYYVVDDTFGAAEVFENPGEGEDTIESNVGITLPANVEGFVFTGSGPLTFTANEADNVVAGSVGDDSLAGGGGEDTISYAYETNPVVINLETGVATGSGTDTLAGFQSATGGSASDLLIGNSAGNVLDGSAGADTLEGGSGNDVYVVDTLADVVVETSNVPPGAQPIQGIAGVTDAVIAAVDYSLAALELIENLTLGPSALNGIGNALDNELVGNELDNSLTGAAGSDSILGGLGDDTLQGNQGSDTLRGGLGDDELRGGQDGDFVYSGQGNDQVFGAFGNDELRGGLGNDTISAGQGNDTLFGGLGDDLLQARLGNDVVTGGAGADRFWFNIAGAADADTILDFVTGVDKIQLDPGFFTDQALVVYDGATGQLSYSGQLIVTLAGSPAFAATDLLFAP